jgi:hypothetical protein
MHSAQARFKREGAFFYNLNAAHQRPFNSGAQRRC